MGCGAERKKIYRTTEYDTKFCLFTLKRGKKCSEMRDRMGGCTLGSSGSGYGQEMDSGEHGKCLGFNKIRDREAWSV